MDGTNAPQHLVRQFRNAQIRQTVLHAGADRRRDRGGLLVDLLEHKVRVAALFSRFHVPVGGQHFPLHRLGELVVELDAPSGHHGQIALFEDAVLPSILQQSRDIRRHKVFALAPADDEGTFPLDGKDGIGEILEQYGQRVAAPHHAQRFVERFQRFALIAVVDEFDEHFRIRLALEGVALCHEPLFQDAVIFNDAVVDDAHPRGGVGVAVHVAGLAMGGPAGVSDAAAAFGQRLKLQLFPQLGKAALALDHPDAALQRQCDAGGIIPTVFQLLQAVQQNILRVALAHITNNATHTKYLQTDSPAQNAHSAAVSFPSSFYVFVWLSFKGICCGITAVFCPSLRLV